MIDDYVAILDIGTTKIVALVGRKDPDGNLLILGYGEENSQGVVRGLVMNINEVSETIKKVVAKAKAQSGIDFKEVYVGIAGQHITSKQISHSIHNEETDIITDKLVKKLTSEVYSMAMNPGEVILHVFPQEYYVGSQPVQNPVGSMGKQLVGQFNISVGNEQSINIIKRSVEMAGLNTIKIILEPVASAEAVLSNEEKEAGVVLIDIGGGTSDMIIYKDKVIRHSAVIPFGGGSITSDIQKGCGILSKQAEEIKKEYGSAIADLVSENECAIVAGIGNREPKEISFKVIAKIIQARLLEIVDTINFELKNSNYYDSIAAGITLTGGGSLLKNINHFIEFRIGLETRIASPEKYIYAEQDAFKNPKYSTAIGLLLKGIEYSQQLNEMKETPYEKKLADLINKKDEKDEKDDAETNSNKKKDKIGFWNRLRGFLIDDDDDIIEEDNKINKVK